MAIITFSAARDFSSSRFYMHVTAPVAVIDYMSVGSDAANRKKTAEEKRNPKRKETYDNGASNTCFVQKGAGEGGRICAERSACA